MVGVIGVASGSGWISDTGSTNSPGFTFVRMEMVWFLACVPSTWRRKVLAFSSEYLQLHS